VLKPLGLKSRSLVANGEMAYPLVRKRRENLNIAGGFDFIDQDTLFPGGGTLINDDLRVIYVRADGDRTLYWGVRPIVVTGGAALRQGIAGLGATGKGNRLLSRAQARPGALVATAEATAFAVLTPQISIRAEVNAQYSHKPLAAYEEYAVGSLTIGRGYDPAYISGDSAIAASFEVHAGPYQPRAGIAVSPYAFFDIAHTSDRDRGGANQTVKSVGVGVQVPVRDRWTLDVGYAQPLDKRAFDRKKPPGRLLVNLTARFF